MWPSGQVAGSPSLDFRGGQAEALNWETWPVAGLRVLRTDEVLWGHSRYRTGEAWETREPWRDWGSRCGGPWVTGGPREGRCPSRLTLEVVLRAVAGWAHKSTDLTSSQLRNFPSCTLSPGGRGASAWGAGPLISRLADLTNVPPHLSHCLPLPAHAQCQHMPWVSCLPAFALAVLPGWLPPLPWAQPAPACLHASPAVLPCQGWSPALNTPQR